MNNEEPIKASHYPDGVVPEIENTDTTQSGENGVVTLECREVDLYPSEIYIAQLF